MAYNVPSKYQPIWNQLKQKHIVSLVAPPIIHKRIIKAVIRRKDLDIAYKFECAELHKRAKLYHSIEGNTITFILKFIPYLNSTGAY